jgi:DNA repair exonuclease SbcCD ATPase subunit
VLHGVNLFQNARDRSVQLQKMEKLQQNGIRKAVIVSEITSATPTPPPNNAEALAEKVQRTWGPVKLIPAEWEEADAALSELVALAKRTEQAEKECGAAKQRAAQIHYNWKEAEADLEAAEAERDRLQHFIDCADTPMMRDVLAERDQLRRRLDECGRRKHICPETYEAERDRYKAALKRYGMHDIDCDRAVDYPEPCNCGLDTASLPKEPSRPKGN